MKPKHSRSFVFLVLVLGQLYVFISCTKSISGNDGEKIEETTQVVIEPALARTFVGAEETVAFHARLTSLAPDSILNVEWKSNTPEIATVNSDGLATAWDLGAANIIALITDTAGNYVASDTARLYSEAKMTLKTTTGYLTDMTDPGPGRDIFVGGTGPATLWQSTDQGDTWEPVSSLPSDMYVQKIHQASSDPGHLMAYLIEQNWRSMSTRNTGLYESADNGKTWNLLTHPDKADPEEEWLYIVVDDVVYAPHLLHTRYATVNLQGDGVSVWRMYRSEDFGLTWHTLKTWSGSPARSQILIDASNLQNIYIGRWGTPYFTYDGGTNWYPLGNLNLLLAIGGAGSLHGYIYPDGNNSSILMKGSINGLGRWKDYYESENYVYHMDTYDEEVLAVLEMNNTNAGHYLNMSLDKGDTWQKFYLSFNDRRTFLRPYMVKVLEYKPDHLDLLLI